MKVEDMLVICADDDPDDRELICETITRIDDRYRILHAQNGREVLKIMDGLRDADLLPCLIMMDLNMPLLGGRETLEQLRQDHYFSKVPVVLFTGTPDKFPELSREYRVNVIAKPWGMKDIETMIRRYLPYCD